MLDWVSLHRGLSEGMVAADNVLQNLDHKELDKMHLLILFRYFGVPSSMPNYFLRQ